MFSTRIRRWTILTLGSAALAACGTSPPPRELLDARTAYARAQAGPAATLKPDALREAQNALRRAEQAYAADVDQRDLRTYAYLAQRRSELADVLGHDAMFGMEQKQAENEIQQVTALQVTQQQQQLQKAEQERADAERRAREAMDRLSNLQGSTVKQEERGIVITLPGQVLFATGKSTLLPTARQKLNQVADALGDTDRHIIVEGHTDSTGSDAKNYTLSEARSNAVKEYLVSRGIPSDRVSAKGLGSSQPVASNASAEGRANNRRVEIVVESGPTTTKKPQQPSP